MAEISFLRIDEVKRRVGLSRSPIYVRIKAGTFPRPVKLDSKAVAWVESEVTAWQDAKIKKRP